MQVLEDNKLKEIIVIGDRVLIKPKSLDNQTNSGLFLPPGVQEKEKVQSGYVVKAGPGIPIPISPDEEEPWKNEQEKVKYLPLQVTEGDLALYLQGPSHEIIYSGEKYFIVPQSAILMIVRDEASLS